MKYFNIASLEGGGTRGIMQAVILTYLTKQWDFVAGTSIGSIIGACIAIGVEPTDIEKFFTVSAPNIFKSGRWMIPRIWSSAKYSPDGLRSALIQILGNKTLADCKCKFIATAFDMKSGRLTYFQSYGNSSEDGDEIVIGPDSKMLLVDVCMASSAAQSYFPGHAWGKYLFWDGGSTGFNCPDMLAIEEATQFAQESEMQMLSIGNGNTSWSYADKDMTNPGIVSVGEATIDMAYSGPENAMVWLAKRRLWNRHFRVNPVIPDYGIDDASDSTLSAMSTAASDELSHRPEVIAAFHG